MAKALSSPAARGRWRRPGTSVGREYPDPDHSPNGRNLVFVGDVAGGREDGVFTVRASGAGRTLATRAYKDAEPPQWTLRP